MANQYRIVYLQPYIKDSLDDKKRLNVPWRKRNVFVAFKVVREEFPAEDDEKASGLSDKIIANNSLTFPGHGGQTYHRKLIELVKIIKSSD
jgi:hypothetical protein